MVVVHVLAGADGQHEHLGAGDIDVHLPGRVAALEQATVVNLFAVGQDTELDTAASACLVIDADEGSEAGAAAAELDIEDAVGVGAQAAFERFAADLQRVAVHGLVLVGIAPALPGLTDVEVGKPDFPAGARARGVARDGTAADNQQNTERRQDTTDSHD